jgi:hypothetical protein
MTQLMRPAALEPRPRDGWLTTALAAVVALPIVVATVRALHRGWMAVGDNGNFLIRSRDVLTSNHPLLGTWSSASIPIGHDVNHPGPLMFDLFAIPAKLAGAGGLAVGVMLLHVVCVALIGFFAWRMGGFRIAAAALFAAGALSWTMGSELLYDPWQPHTLLLPLLLLLVLAAGMTQGDQLALPAAIAVASLLVQTHLSYTLLAPPLCLWGLAWLVRRHGFRGVLRAVVATVVVGLLCWSQPIADQVTGEGNLGTLASSLGTKQETVGAGLGVRIAADVLGVPPFWGRDGFGDDIRVPKGQSPLRGVRPNVAGLSSGMGALLGLAVVGALLVLAWLRARQQRDVAARAFVGVAGAALVIALFVTVRLPVGGVGVPPHQVRYLWPVAVFVTGAVVVSLLPRSWAGRALAAAAVVLAVLTLPFHAVPAGPQDDRDAIPVVRALSHKLDSLQDEGTLVYDTSQLRFAEPWTSALMAVFQEQGIDFTVDDHVWARQLGSGRLDRGDADARVFVREGDAAREVPSGGVRRVAYVEGLDMDEQRELASLERKLIDLPIVLNPDGEAARASGALPQFVGDTPTAEQLLAFGGLAGLVNDGLLSIPADRADEVARYASLRYRWDRHPVALFLDPTPYDD